MLRMAVCRAVRCGCRYRQGALRSKFGDDQPLKQRVEAAARWLDMTVRSCDDADVVDDWELDELLCWSAAVDFDDYWKDWQTIATSDLSEAAVRKSNLPIPIFLPCFDTVGSVTARNQFRLRCVTV